MRVSVSVLVGILSLGLAGSVTAAESDWAELERAEGLAASDRCSEAQALLDAAALDAIGELRGARAIARCHIRTGHAAEARAALETAMALDPDSAEHDLDLALARYYAGDVAAAEAALASAREKGLRSAELQLYEGLVLLESAKTREAAESFESASRLDPDRVEPIASYFAAMAWASLDDRRAAAEALERVATLAPGSDWADQAESALADLGEPQQGPRAGWFTLNLGTEYDNNALLRGSSVRLPDEISSQRDMRALGLLEVGSTLIEGAGWSSGGALSYYGSFYDELEGFDTHYPGFSLWLDREVGETSLARLEFDLGYGWVDAKPFVFAQNLTPSFYHGWGDRLGTTQFYARFSHNRFFGSGPDDEVDGIGVAGDPCASPADDFCGPAGVNESQARDRDGEGMAFGFAHAVPLGFAETLLRGGYEWEHYSAEGREYTHDGHQVWLGARSRLPLDLTLDASVRYSYQPYRDRSTFPDPNAVFFNTQYDLASARRRDQILQFDVSLERAVSENLSLTARFGSVRNRSNVAVFDYKQQVIGLYGTLRFQR